MEFEIEKVLSRATVENCMKSMQIRDLACPSRLCHITRGSNQNIRIYKSLVSSGRLYCVRYAEAKAEVFETNPEAWRHPQEREECVRKGHI